MNVVFKHGWAETEICVFKHVRPESPEGSVFKHDRLENTESGFHGHVYGNGIEGVFRRSNLETILRVFAKAKAEKAPCLLPKPVSEACAVAILTRKEHRVQTSTNDLTNAGQPRESRKGSVFLERRDSLLSRSTCMTLSKMSSKIFALLIPSASRYSPTLLTTFQ